MRLASWEFTPGLWPTSVTFLVLPVFIYLGLWQLDRAEQKRALHHEFETRQDADVIDLNSMRALHKSFDELNWRNISAEGTFSEEINILLDNQIENGMAGYFVYSPFKLKEQNLWVLVNRGWITVGDSRDVPPRTEAAEEALNITGSVKPPPWTGILLAENIIEQLDESTYRVQKLELNGIEELLNIELLPYIIRMDLKSPAGFIRQWKVPGTGEEKNLGYAFQWFAMATVILFVYLILSIKRAK